jgi:hypothetical protein
MIIKTDIKGFTDYVDKLKDRFMPAINDGVYAGATRCLPLMLQRTEKTSPASNPNGSTRAVGANNLYFQSWHVERKSFGARLFNSAPYAPIIEYGRRPNKPVSIQGRKDIGKWAKKVLHLSDSEAEAASWAIAKSIQKKGLLPRNVMTGADQEMSKFVEEAVLEKLDAELNKK